MRCAQDRAQLSQEKPWLGETEPHCAQAERRIRRHSREPIDTFRVFVGAEIERANHNGFAVHSLGNLAIRLELLFLGRQPLTIQEQELES